MTQRGVTPPSNRRARERQARVNRIQAAAARVFARRGFDLATMEQVAREAELGKASIYYYFETKQALFASIVSAAVKDLGVNLMQVVVRYSDPLDVIEEVCRFTLDYFRRDRDRLALFLPLIAGGQEQLAARLGTAVAEQVRAAHGSMFSYMQQAGAGRQRGAAMAQMVNSFLLGLGAKLVHGGGQDLDAEVDLFVKLLRRAHHAGERQ